ncbi:hypothetical protein FVEG_06637 [Fusarium verticillioides 7600]|uniref:Uncharacterized protein n=1 Tax=Gibberella moniliformis (strain M3125 / FGSC 7600) TaxID=334819 RepID=W7M395_GIBM7|nr:hypothetical protein FVEG_06637 [Fusarium verticillioides 7600]EWG46038.1 hypothetical protein FVEG_06637 [Fusarium verticillioides 7600]
MPKQMIRTSSADTQEQKCHSSTGEVHWFDMVLWDLWRGRDCGQALRQSVQLDLERLTSPGACFGCLQMRLETCTRMNLRGYREGFHRVPYHKWWPCCAIGKCSRMWSLRVRSHTRSNCVSDDVHD